MVDAASSTGDYTHKSLALDAFYDDCNRYKNDYMGQQVCGDNGITYHNLLDLHCMSYKQNKNKAVKMMYFGSCPGSKDKSGCPWSPIYEPVCGSDGKTYVNEERLLCSCNQTGEEVTVVSKGECKEVDPCRNDENKSHGPKVCATNGITYQSAEAVRCLSKHKSDIEIKHEGGCSVDEVHELYPSREKVCAISKHHYEYNPVCGVDELTYLNPFVFLCYCPLTEAVFSGGECHCSSHDACLNAINLDDEYEECRKEVDLKEVCGSDGLTYRSKDHLLCAARNNTMLHILHEGKCKREDSPCIHARTAEGHPVCGSDGMTYSNRASLHCVARNKDPNLKYVHDGPCIPCKKRTFNPSFLQVLVGKLD
ncbi:serine protease inhibitor dipetalogastin [Halyomorpha halys]|uniref:serine protease inhibitor dipetalogastin n=1 Tax=Halyomorpha halys TaxID=286706 RepID=UPI0006D4EE5A